MKKKRYVIKKHRFSLVLLLFFVLGISLLVSMLPKKQNLQTKATKATILSFSPSSTQQDPISRQKDDPFSLDVMVDPGTNYVSIVKLQILYDREKFEGTGDKTLVINSGVFPTIMEGPVISANNGSIIVTLSIGTDPSKAIKTPTKIATINLKAISPTKTDFAIVEFGEKSAVYSVAPTDHAFQNVLATATSAYVRIGNFINPSVTLNPSVTTNPSFPPSVTPILSPPVSPTPDPQATNFVTTVCLDGIGSSGDSTNPADASFSNKSPQKQQRNITISVIDGSNKLIGNKSGIATYNQGNGCFTGMISMGAFLPQGKHFVKIKTDSFLQKQITHLIQITNTPRVVLPPVTLIAGDITGDNIIDIKDYNILIGCYSDIGKPVSCDEVKQKSADINDDGKVNQNDYNLFIREISVQRGN